MGSFSYTCAVTHTPIVEGNNVRVIFGVTDQNNSVLRTYSRDTFQPFGLSLNATYGEGDGNFNWGNGEVHYHKGETRCHCVATRILRAISQKTKLGSLSLRDIINTLRAKGESDEFGVGWMVVHEHVYQSIVSDYLINGYSYESLSAFYEKPESIESIEFADFMIEQYVMKALERDGSINCAEMREFFTSIAEELYGSDIGTSYFREIFRTTDSIINGNSLVLRAMTKDETDVFDNAAGLLSFCRFMELHNLPMLKSQATWLASGGAHIELYKKMTEWCRDI